MRFCFDSVPLCQLESNGNLPRLAAKQVRTALGLLGKVVSNDWVRVAMAHSMLGF
jgi:hypothetical protein